MKTLLFTLEYPPFKGGVANYYGNLVKSWPKKNAIGVLDNNDGLLISKKNPKWLPAIIQLYKKIKYDKIEYVLVGQILPLGIAAWFVSLLTKTRYAVFIHGMDAELAVKTPKKRFISRLILSKADKVICASHYTSELLNRLFQDKYCEKIKVVHPGINIRTIQKTGSKDRVDEIKKEMGLDGKIVLFSVGRLVYRKGFDMILKALPSVTEEVPNIVYLLAGKGPDEEGLKKMAKKLPNVRFLGIIDEEKKWLLMELCDIFITIPRYEKNDFEGFGIVFLEAALAGKPAIAGNSGGVDEAVEDGQTGLLVDPLDLESISGAIIELARNPQLRYSLGSNGLRRSVEEFNWNQQAKKVFLYINKN